MKTARFTVRIVVGTAVIGCFAAASALLPVKAAQDCPHDAVKSIAQARAAVRAADPASDHAALVCLIEAVTALSAQLDELRATTSALVRDKKSGTVVLRKTTTREAR